MVKVVIKYLSFLSLVIAIASCKTPYTPTPVTTPTNYLVVEGLINISDSTYVNLSRTVALTAATTVKPELKATVTIESNTGGSYPLKEVGNGVYSTPNLNLNAANQYRLRIKTSNGSTYTSDFTPAKVSPPIDSITWKTTPNALNIFANTHDPNNSTRYYRWDFTEEWRFHSNYFSDLVSNGVNLSFRTPTQQIYYCYAGDASTSTSLGTSAQLSNDVISNAQVNSIASDAEKIGIEYSILVKQYALTKDAYDYWALLQKNTQQLGSIFDSQPSSSIGNVHNINNENEVVVGYISAGTFTTQRIFILKSQLPNWSTTPSIPQVACGPDSLNCCVPPNAKPITTDQYVNFLSANYIGGKTPLTPIALIDPNAALTNTAPITAGAPICIDCTVRGKSAPPGYWK